MIGDMGRLNEVLEEIAAWGLPERRAYIASIEKAFGLDASQQLRDGLTEMWKRK